MVYFKFGRRTITTYGRLSRLLDGGHNNGITPLRPQNDDEETISIGEERITIRNNYEVNFNGQQISNEEKILIGHRGQTIMEPGYVWAPIIPLAERYNPMTMIVENNFKFGK